MRRLLGEAGRDAGSFPVGKRVYIAVDPEPTRAWKGLEKWFALRYGRTEYQHIAIWGPADECATKVQEVIDATRFYAALPLFISESRE